MLKRKKAIGPDDPTIVSQRARLGALLRRAWTDIKNKAEEKVPPSTEEGLARKERALRTVDPIDTLLTDEHFDNWLDSRRKQAWEEAVKFRQGLSWPRSPNLSPDKGREVKLAHINDDGDNLDFPSDDRRASCEVKLVDPAQAQTSLTAEIHFDVEKLDVTREDGKGGTPSRLNDSGSFPLPQTLNFRLGKQVSENVLATVFVVETINGKEGSAPRRYLRAVQTITCRAPYAKKGWAVRFFKSDPDLPIHSEPEGPYTAFWLPPSTLSDGDPQPLQLTPRLTFPEGKLPSKVLVQCFYPDPMAPGTGPLASRDERNWHSLATTKEFAPPDMVPGGIREVSLSFSTATPAGQQPVAEVPNIDVKRGIRFVVREAGAKQQQQPLADILMMPRFWTHVAFVKKGTLDPRMGPAPPGRVHFDIEAAAPPSAGEASLLPPKFNVTIDPKRIDSRVLRKGDKKLRAELGFGGTDYLFFDIDREQLEKALEPGKNSHFEFSANIDAYSHAYRFRFSDTNQIEPVPVPHVRIAEPMPYDVLVLPDDSQKGKKVAPISGSRSTRTTTRTFNWSAVLSMGRAPIRFSLSRFGGPGSKPYRSRSHRAALGDSRRPPTILGASSR